ncbi:MAG TPA: ABC transporter permease [Terriglobia bacterium]|nr:ABC transporter permease [Terriglobia bacterium]
MKFLAALTRIRHMLRKEFIQTLRDPRTRFLLIGPPLIQMLVFGYAATLDVKNVTLAVLDLDNTQESRELVGHFSGSRYFHLQKYVERREDLREGIDRGGFLVALEIDSGFARRLRNGQGATVQVLVDCANSNTGLVALGYLNQIGAQFARDYQLDLAQRVAPQIAFSMPRVDLETRPWFNEGLESRWYFVPAVIGNVTMIMVMMLTAFAVVREREIGTLEQIMVTPIRRWEFIVGKTVPFFLIGCFDAGIIALVGTLWFEVPFRGELGVLALGLVVFIFAALGIGLLLSTISSTQQQAMITSMFFIMPMITLSGFATPIPSMPPFFQKLTFINPMRYIMVVLRSVYLKGVGLDILWPQIAALAAFAVVLLGFSVLRFHKSLE